MGSPAYSTYLSILGLINNTNTSLDSVCQSPRDVEYSIPSRDANTDTQSAYILSAPHSCYDRILSNMSSSRRTSHRVVHLLFSPLLGSYTLSWATCCILTIPKRSRRRRPYLRIARYRPSLTHDIPTFLSMSTTVDHCSPSPSHGPGRLGAQLRAQKLHHDEVYWHHCKTLPCLSSIYVYVWWYILRTFSRVSIQLWRRCGVSTRGPETTVGLPAPSPEDSEAQALKR